MVDIRQLGMGNVSVTRVAADERAARELVKSEYPDWQVVDVRPMFQRGDGRQFP